MRSPEVKLQPGRNFVLLLALGSAVAAAEPVDALLEPIAPAPRELASWEDAVAEWSKQSTDLRINASEVVRAAARTRSAWSNLLPSISGSALASFSLLPAPSGGETQLSALFGAAPYQTLGLVAQLNVIDVRSWNAVAAASDAERAAKLSVDDARRLLLLNLSQALLNVVTAERVAELNRSGLRDALARLHLTDRANAAGASTELDVGRLRQDVEAARAQVVTGDEALRQARETLGLSLGVSEPVSVRPDFQLNGLAEQIRGTCRSVGALQERADQLAARARVEVAHRAVLDADSQFLPSLAVRTNAQAYIFGAQGVFPVWNLQAVLTVPLWDGGNRYGVRRDAVAQESQAEARRLATERQGTVDVARAQRAIDVAERSRSIAAASLEQAQKTEALTRKAWDAGFGTSLELVTAASALRAQQLTLAIRDYDVLRARVVFLFALANCSP